MNVAIATTVSNEKNERPPQKILRYKLRKRYSDCSEMGQSAETKSWNAYPENEVIESLRFLQDEGFITACEDGIHYKNK